MPPLITIVLLVIFAFAGFFAGGYYKDKKNEEQIGTAEEIAQKILNNANRDAETQKREAIIEAKDEIHLLRERLESANEKRQNELADLERRLLLKQEQLDEKSSTIDEENEKINKRFDKVNQREHEVQHLIEEQTEELHRVGAMSKEEAQEIILTEARENTIADQAKILREFKDRTEEESEMIAREIVTRTIQRYASDYIADSTVSVVSLPNDEMKGRIIGREGRNIRAFENLTGVDLIIDDTPQAVVVSAFDPVRREKARVALEKLVADGRIHPTRIEELYAKAEKEVNASIREAGERALEDVGIRNMHPELVKLLGKLKYRTSYGQNALEHSIEVANFAAMLAEEVGANVKIAKRGGLLHDLGKAIDHEIDQPHVDLGVRAARKYKESEEVIHCIESHHNDVEPSSLEAILVQASDTISAARPGARRESMELYIKRLEDLEAIANSFDGIEEAYAIQAGREIRIIVQPDQVSEDEMTVLVNDVAKKIEESLEYPGQIKINLIRETRAESYAS